MCAQIAFAVCKKYVDTLTLGTYAPNLQLHPLRSSYNEIKARIAHTAVHQ